MSSTKKRQQTSHKTKIDLILVQVWYKFYSTLLTEAELNL
jgi:hypothetical protein